MQLKTLSAQSKQASAAALEGTRSMGQPHHPHHRRAVSEGVGGVVIGSGGGVGASAGRRYAGYPPMTLAQLQHKRAAQSKVGGSYGKAVSDRGSPVNHQWAG